VFLRVRFEIKRIPFFGLASIARRSLGFKLAALMLSHTVTKASGRLMIDYIVNSDVQGFWLFFLIIATAWLWEDASVIGGALLASDGAIAIPLAVLAVFVGICSGDLGLYYLGRLSHRWRALRGRLLLNDKFRSLRKLFRRKTVVNILIVRFIPGLRAIGFTMCGFWHIPLARFLFAMSLAGALWIAVVFSLIYRLGASEFLQNSQWKWSLMLVALVLLVFNNLYFRYRFGRKTKN